MNWAGGQGFAQSFLGTLQGLTALERAQLQMEEMRQQQAERKAFRGVIGEEMGRVGQTPETSTGAIRSALGGTAEAAPGQMSAIPAEGSVRQGLREAAGVQEGMGSAISAQTTAVPASTTPVTREDAIMNVFNRGMSVAPELTFDFVLKGLQLEDVLDTRQKKKAFQKDLAEVRSNMMDLQSAAADAENNPEGVFVAAKKFGINLQPIATSPTTVAYEAYQNGKKVGQFNTLSDAAAAGVQAYTTNAFGELALRHSVDPKDMLGVMNVLDQMDVRRRELGIKESQEERAATAAPLQQELTRAQINQVKTATAGADLEQKDKAEYRDIRSRILKLLENPSPENQPELRQLARRAGILNPKEVLVTRPVMDPATGITRNITTNVFTGEVQESLAEAGIPNVPAGARRQAENLARQGLNADGKPATAKDIADYEATFGPWPGSRQAPAARGGRTSAIPARPSPAATIRQVQGLPPRIPEPPPREIARAAGRGGGTIRTPNPAYDEWERQYGEAYRAQQR
jgi:hypothetical protein